MLKEHYTRGTPPLAHAAVRAAAAREGWEFGVCEVPGLRVIWIRGVVYRTRLQVLSAGRARFINNFLLEGHHQRRKMVENWMREGTVHHSTDSKYTQSWHPGNSPKSSAKAFFLTARRPPRMGPAGATCPNPINTNINSSRKYGKKQQNAAIYNKIEKLEQIRG